MGAIPYTAHTDLLKWSPSKYCSTLEIIFVHYIENLKISFRNCISALLSTHYSFTGPINSIKAQRLLPRSKINRNFYILPCVWVQSHWSISLWVQLCGAQYRLGAIPLGELPYGCNTNGTAPYLMPNQNFFDAKKGADIMNTLVDSLVIFLFIIF